MQRHRPSNVGDYVFILSLEERAFLYYTIELPFKVFVAWRLVSYVMFP